MAKDRLKKDKTIKAGLAILDAVTAGKRVQDAAPSSPSAQLRGGLDAVASGRTPAAPARPATQAMAQPVKTPGTAPQISLGTAAQNLGQTALKAAKPASLGQTALDMGNALLQQAQKEATMKALMRNSIRWHGTDDEQARAALQAANDVNRAKLGLRFDPASGRTMNLAGENLSAPIEITFGARAARPGSIRNRLDTAAAGGRTYETAKPEIKQLHDRFGWEPAIPDRLALTFDSAKRSVTGGITNTLETSTVAREQDAEAIYLKREKAIRDMMRLDAGASRESAERAAQSMYPLGFFDRQALRQKYGSDWDAKMQARYDAEQDGDAEALAKFEELDRFSEMLNSGGSAEMSQAAQLQERAKKGTEGADSAALDLLDMGAQMLASSAIAGPGNPAGFTAVSSIQQAGQAADEAKRLGADASTQESYGNTVGIINAAIERLGGIGGAQAPGKLLKSALPEGAQAVLARAGDTAIGEVAGNALEEGAENLLQYGVTVPVKNHILGTDEQYSLGQAANEFGSGAIMGGIFGGARALGNRIGDRMSGTRAEAPQAAEDGVPDAQPGKGIPEAGQAVQDGTGQKKSPADAELSSHTPEMQKIIQEYRGSVDSDLLDFVEANREGTLYQKAKLNLGNVSKRAAADIKDLIGLDIDGYRIIFDKSSAEHIEKRHGAEGAADHSMSDAADIARLPYVLQNYDRVEDLHDTTGKVSNRDNTPASLVRFSKRVDGTYYIVEAVPDSAKKTVNIVAAYLEQAKKQAQPGKRQTDMRQAPHSTDVPAGTEQTQSVVPSSMDSISQTGVKSNTDGAESQTLGGAHPVLQMQYGGFGEQHLDNGILRPYNGGKAVDGKGVDASGERIGTQGAQFTGIGRRTAAPIPEEPGEGISGDAGRQTTSILQGFREKDAGAAEVAESRGGIGEATVNEAGKTEAPGGTFHTRTNQTATDFLAAAASAGRETAQFGQVTYAYTRTPDAELSETARQVSSILREKYGIEAVVFNNDMLCNDGKTTVSRPMEAAATAPDGRVFVINTVDMDPAEVAGHEKLHYVAKTFTDDYQGFRDGIFQDNVNYHAAELEKALETIASAYCGENYDLTDPEQSAKIFEELAAYLSGWREAMPDALHTRYKEWFHDSQAVEVGYQKLDALLTGREKGGSGGETPGTAQDIRKLSPMRMDYGRVTAPDEASIAKAQGQLDALVSDAYEQPDLDAHVRAAETANEQLDALESDSYLHDRSQRAADGTEADKQAESTLARMERVAANHPVERATVRASKSGADVYLDDARADAAIRLSNSLEGQRLTLKSLAKAFHLTQADLVNAREIASGRGAIAEIPKDKADQMAAYVNALRMYDNNMQDVYQYRKEMRAAREKRADEIIIDSDRWKDARFGLTLAMQTPERVLRKVCGDTEATQRMIDEYITPVHEHEAESVKWQRAQRAKLQEVMEGSTHEESVYAHMVNRLNLDPHNEVLQKATFDYFREHAKKIRTDKIDGIIDALCEITQGIHPEISEAWIRNGYDPLEFHKDYIPSIPPTHEGTIWNRILRKFGVETKADELPTDIAGLTEDRRPGRQYAAYSNERSGLNTEFDAFKAIDNYITSAANEIFHTDDIQNLRALEERIRYKYSSEGAQAEMAAIANNPTIQIDERTQAMSDIWEENSGTLPHFPSWIGEYANLLSGKKARRDRGVEKATNRSVYRAVGDIEGKVAANLAGGNIRTALSNFIPLMQGGAELRKSSMAGATLDYFYDLFNGDTDFEDMSMFLTNRRGSERAVKTGLQKASDFASKPMGMVDMLASNVLTRARYKDNIRNGMEKGAAIREADAWTAGVMADRSKGAMPNIFNSKNPLIKAFTMFQLEVPNQYGYLFKDMPRNLKEKGISAIAGVLLQVFVGSYLFNDALEALTGTRAAFDPIDIVNNFIGELTGYKLPNTFDTIKKAMDGDLSAEDFQTEPTEKKWDIVKHTAQEIASNVPFISGPLGGLFGASNARMPVQSAIPNIDAIMSKQGAARVAAAKKELAKPLAYLLPPFGGAQVKKTIEGIAAQRAGGSYTVDKDGRPILQFPDYGESPLSYVQGGLFGKHSSKEAREYVDSGFERLNADETEVYDEADRHGLDRRTAYEAIQTVAAAKAPEDKSKSEVQAKREAIMSLDLTPGQKAWLDFKLLGGADKNHKVNYQDMENFKITTQLTSAQKQLDARRAMDDYGISADTFIQYNTAFNKAQRTPRTTPVQAREAVLSQIQADGSLEEREKTGLIETLLIKDLGERRRVDWAITYRNQMEPALYVQIADKYSEIQKQYEDYEGEISKTAICSTDFSMYIDTLPLSSALRESVRDDFKYFNQIPAESIPYKWDMLDSEDEVKYRDKLAGTGLDIGVYNDVRFACKDFKADRDSDGKPISGSKKEKVINYVRSRDDLTREQQNYIIQMMGYKLDGGSKKGGGLKTLKKMKLPTLKMTYGR